MHFDLVLPPTATGTPTLHPASMSIRLFACSFAPFATATPATATPQESASLDPFLLDLMAPEDSYAANDEDWADLMADESDDIETSDLAELSPEALMGLNVEVTSVSRKAESLQRMAPGIRVTRLSSGRYAVTAMRSAGT